MKIFISWSGKRSELVAQQLVEILKLLNLETWFSKDDIRKGEMWRYELTENLKTSDIAIICLTSYSIISKWVMFEVGMCLSSSPAKRVCPLLIGLTEENLRNTPLDGFQITKASDQLDVESLLRSIYSNESDSNYHLKATQFKNHFDYWLPKFVDTMKKLPTEEQEARESKNKTFIPLKNNKEDLILTPLLDKIDEQCNSQTLATITKQFLDGKNSLSVDSQDVLDALMHRTMEWIRLYLETQPDRHYQVLMRAGLIAIAIISRSTDNKAYGQEFMRKCKENIAGDPRASYVGSVLKTSIHILTREEKPEMSYFSRSGS